MFRNFRGTVLGIARMQTSGFATLPNALAAPALLYQIPVLMMISERAPWAIFSSE